MKRTGILLALAGAGWASYHIHHNLHNFGKFLPKDVIELEQKAPQYIYYQPSFSGRAQIEAFWLPQYLWWWRSVPSSVAWRLLRLAQSGCLRERLKAVHSLALLENLEDSDCYQIAQACDVRTSVGLARTKGVDLRLFLKPPVYPPPIRKEDLIDRCHEMLVSLDNGEAHECVQYFVSQVLSEVQDRKAQYSSRINEEYVLTLCLKSILHHSNLPTHSDDIIRLGGLKLLMDIYYHFPESNHILSIVAKIISNICEPHHAKSVMLSGWMGVLAKWMSSSLVQIKSPASKALAKLDTDDSSSYKAGVYPLHPLYRYSGKENIKADVIFIHGLLGGVFWTWRLRDKTRIDFSNSQNEEVLGSKMEISEGMLFKLYKVINDIFLKLMYDNEIKNAYRVVHTDCPVLERRSKSNQQLDMSACGNIKGILCPEKDVTKCWPVDWLSKDLPSLRVIGLNYDTFISLWMPVCPEETLHTSLEQRSSEFIEKLKASGIGHRPIIWVAHSMGGLIVKNVLVKALKSSDKEAQNLAKNTRGIVFYSVPHKGSQIANLKQGTRMLLLPSNEVKELGYNSPKLLQLHEEFLELSRKFQIEVLSFAEMESTLISSLKYKCRIVDTDSADPGIGEFFEIPSDHLNICKPSNRKSFLYQKFLMFVEDILRSR